MCEILRQNQCKKLDTKSKVNAFLNLLFKIIGEMELELIDIDIDIDIDLLNSFIAH